MLTFSQICSQAPTMRITVPALVILAGCRLSFPFQAQSFVVRTVALNHQQRTNSLPRLQYRELDEEDDNDVMLQVQTRAPPGFDMKETLAKQRASRSAMNVPLIRALLLNQGIILAIATALSAVLILASDGFNGFSNLNEIFRWSGEGEFDLASTPLPLLVGVAGAVPIVLFGNLIEDSDNREFANINFSTIVMVMTLFGRRKSPPDEFLPDHLKGKTYPTTATTDALLQSFVLSVVTGVCEEIVFRMEVPGLLNHFFGGFPLLPLVDQAIVFALGHSSQRGTSFQENGIVVGLQLINGSWFGLIYLLSGGDLVVCMVAHAVYDFIVFFKTWMDSNGQIEYAESMWSEPLPAEVQKQVDTVLRKGKRLDPKMFNMVKRLFYTFDFDKNKTLSKSEVRKGFSYLALEKAGTPRPQEQVDALFDNYTSVADKSRLTFLDFLRLYATTSVARTVG
jgi:membrane protease YdiL (CAAX protease family)